MSMSVKDVLQNTHWWLFRSQKEKLQEIAANLIDDDLALIDGLLNFIDALQDAVVEEGIATEAQVFGELNDNDN